MYCVSDTPGKNGVDSNSSFVDIFCLCTFEHSKKIKHNSIASHPNTWFSYVFE